MGDRQAERILFVLKQLTEVGGEARENSLGREHWDKRYQIFDSMEKYQLIACTEKAKYELSQYRITKKGQKLYKESKKVSTEDPYEFKIWVRDWLRLYDQADEAKEKPEHGEGLRLPGERPEPSRDDERRQQEDI